MRKMPKINLPELEKSRMNKIKATTKTERCTDAMFSFFAFALSPSIARMPTIIDGRTGQQQVQKMYHKNIPSKIPSTNITSRHVTMYDEQLTIEKDIYSIIQPMNGKKIEQDNPD